MKNTLHTAVLTLVVLGASAAHAHGDQAHSMPPPFDPATVEATDYGQPGDPAKVNRTVHVGMGDDMRFKPARLAVKRGETIRFVVRNAGRMLHEMVIGTPEAIDTHAALMKKFPGMEHADANMAHVKPGQRGDIVWQFTKAGEFRYACLVPGHYEAGMVGTVTVK